MECSTPVNFNSSNCLGYLYYTPIVFEFKKNAIVGLCILKI